MNPFLGISKEPLPLYYAFQTAEHIKKDSVYRANRGIHDDEFDKIFADFILKVKNEDLVDVDCDELINFLDHIYYREYGELPDRFVNKQYFQMAADLLDKVLVDKSRRQVSYVILNKPSGEGYVRLLFETKKGDPINYKSGVSATNWGKQDFDALGLLKNKEAKILLEHGNYMFGTDRLFDMCFKTGGSINANDINVIMSKVVDYLIPYFNNYLRSRNRYSKVTYTNIVFEPMEPSMETQKALYMMKMIKEATS